MEIKIKLNGKMVSDDIPADMLLIDFVRAHNCFSVKRGCETSSCGLCTVLLDDQPVLSCSMLAARADGHSVYTLEGLQEEASEFVGYIADQGAEQCGFCNPGFVMNTIALLRENLDPTDEEILAYLSGNLCRCSGYVGQQRGIRNFLNSRNRRRLNVNRPEYQSVGKSVRKKDSLQLLRASLFTPTILPRCVGGEIASKPSRQCHC